MTWLADLVAALEPLIRSYGAGAVSVIILLESFGMPLPGESMLLFAAALAGRGELSLPTLMLGAWIGAVLGDNIGYLIGRRGGRALVLRFGGRVGLDAARLARVEAVFARWGPLTVAGARFFAVLRQLNGIVAGTLAMEWRRFLVFNAIGAALWVGLWMTLGWLVGEHAAALLAAARRFRPALVVVVALVAAAAGAVWWRRRAG
ncbi:DedA family protein [Rhodoplanes sp. TEM]|uniref:DedA family protein n=1 Tax=Rhodoplanes tepidamans TaxID=200616 RepID=A0ABT5JB99_RHOTP|nr:MULTISPECIES: DedA family protein [Rhodoplanes]MDC7786955.1 DedA family protein [Rhodoplanes tepidamans]MDC7985054.1 DedA family protein [Rhodoplanes sp. TEM]MDQ0355348.1 membrane protein DedA with SNARE-associated domain [Rhodoplanes tepidamans]